MERKKIKSYPQNFFLPYKYWNFSCIAAAIQITLPELVYPEEITFVVTQKPLSHIFVQYAKKGMDLTWI